MSRVCPMVCVSARLSPLLCVFHLLRFVCVQIWVCAPKDSILNVLQLPSLIGPNSRIVGCEPAVLRDLASLIRPGGPQLGRG